MEKYKISEKKLFTILAIDLFSLTGLILPAAIVRTSGNQGLPALLLASAFGILFACYFLWITKNGEFCYDSALADMPVVFNYGITVLYSIRYFLHGLFLIVIFRALIEEVLLSGQNPAWFLLPFFVLVYLSAGKAISVRGSILEVLFPYIFVPLLIVLILALFYVDYGSLPEQLWGGNILNSGTAVNETVMNEVVGSGNNIGSTVNSANSLLTAAYQIAFFFQPIEFLLFLTPCRAPEKRKKGYGVFLACFFVIVVNVLFYVAAVGMFGNVRVGEKLWSALYIMQSIKLPGHFVQRLDILFLVFYIFSTFALFSGYLFYSEILIVTRQKRWHKKVYPLVYLTGMYILAIMIKDVEGYYEFFLNYKMWVDVPLALLLPLVVRGWTNRSKNYKKKASMLLSILCVAMGLSISFTGCQSKVDIEDRNYVMSLGIAFSDTSDIDDSNQPNEANQTQPAYQITYETADLTKSSEAGGGRQAGIFATFTANSLKEAEEKEKMTDDKKIDYGHLKAILIKKDLLGTSQWDALIAELEQKKEIAGTTLIFITEDRQEEYMQLTEGMGTSLGEYLERMMSNHKKDGIEEYTLSDLLRDEAENVQEISFPYLSMDGDKLLLSKFDSDTTKEKTLTPLAAQVLRFHIRANSDTPEDQAFKTRIKDRILPYLQNLFAQCSSKEECIETARNHLKEIEEQVQKACEEERPEEAKGINTSVYLCRESFPLKQYGAMIFPSGVYDALRIDLGEGEGANWWCMMYPSLCMADGVVEGVTEEAQEKLEECLASEDYESLFYEEETGKKSKFHIKWRISSIFQQFFGEMAP